jgi:hypothetical protein
VPLTSIRRRVSAIRNADPRLADLVLLYLAIKVALVVVALLGSQLLPFNWHLYRVNLLLDVQGLPEVFRPFNTWDTQHYLFLSQRGYGVNPMSNAFYPLYPYLVWLATPLFFNRPLIAAYVIANIFSLLVPIYMYRLGALFFTKEQAFRATVLLLTFPTAFFLSVAYTESLYLSLCLMAFYYLFRGDVPKASLACFLLPLVRAQALLFVAPIAVLLAEALLHGGGDIRAAARRVVVTFVPPALATVLGIGVYFALCRWQLGGFLAGLSAQQLYVAKNSLGNILSPVDWFAQNFVNVKLELHSYTTSMIDRAAFLLCLPTLIGVYRTQPVALFVYAALTMLVPALAGSFMSYTRFLLVVFPMFLYLGVRLPRAEYYLAAPMFALQILLYLLHTGGYWVA